MIRPVGPRGLLADCRQPAAAAAALRQAGIDLEEVVPGAATVLAVARHAGDVARMARALGEAAGATADPAGDAETVEIPVRYDGPDLDGVAREVGLDAVGVVELHSGATYRGAFSGFAPGFCYLSGLPEALHLPRLADPRPAVPVGAVAIADRYSAVYPRATPGGWRLLGTTGAPLWDPDRSPAALVRPGTVVRFVPA